MTISIAIRYGSREYYTKLNKGKQVLLGSDPGDDIQIPDSPAHDLKIQYRADTITASLQGKKQTVEPNQITVLDQKRHIVLYASVITGPCGTLSLPYDGRVSVGRGRDNQVVLSYPIVSGHHFALTVEKGSISVEDLKSTNHLYLNGAKISSAELKSGDVLSIYTFRFVLEDNVLRFENMGKALKITAVPSPPALPVRTEKTSAVYPVYHTSPRLREQLPKETIILAAAPGQGPAGSGRRGNWAYLIGSGAMMAASLATGLMSPVMLLTRLAGMVSPLANMAMFNKMSREEQEQLLEYERLRQEKYQAYIDEQKARITKIADTQRRILTDENPDPLFWMETAKNLDRRLWERMAQDNDFLSVRLGLGSEKLCVEVKTRADVDGFSMQDDEIEKLSARIIEETRYVDKMPIRADLRSCQTIGMAGPRDRVFYQLRAMLVELSSQHSFKDLRLVGLFNKEDQALWGILRWIPHFSDETGQVRYLAFSESQVHTVCEILKDMIRRRKDAGRDSSLSAPKMPLPHFVIIASDRNVLLHERIWSDLSENRPSLGITTIVLGENLYDLPQACQFLVDLTDKPAAYEREKFDERRYFMQDAKVHQKDMESFARRLAAIELEDQSADASLPSSVTFLQGYHVKTVEELGIRERWKSSEPFRTLEAPIGMMSGGKVFSLNIRSGENAHGPHGLLAGTTGSGKSELLQTWILSMAVNYHPHDVNFVIIDYKGGGMSDLLELLPHVVGDITNIDRNIGRSLVSLKSELKRRERLFSAAGVNNIDKYQRAYHAGEVKERLPHLILVTDEFAELKKEEPEFMAELNSVAATGRSLGIHMLLSTQKPAGVVNDQISSNSRFRICMKVQDVADSREMLKRPDAARITQAGRAYVRVGEDELFSLFQSFYSAAEYTGNSSEGGTRDNRVRIVGVTGNRIQPVKKTQQRRLSDLDELTAVIRCINDICREDGIEKMPGPWLPELPHWLPLESLLEEGAFDGSTWPLRRKGLSVPIGRYDIPEKQSQGPQYMDFVQTGHFGIYGSPGSGKTCLLKTVILSLGLHYMPRDVRITVIDAGSWSLGEFTDMPHVEEVILNQEEEKLARFTAKLRREMEERKKAFLKAAVNSLTAYRETVSDDLPALVIVVDQISQMFEQSMDFADLMESVAASGATYGIYLLFTANTSIGLKYKFLQMIKGAVTLQMPDKGDYTSIVGPITGISLPHSPGRGLLRCSPPIAFQTAMYLDRQNDQQRHEDLVLLTKKMLLASASAAPGKPEESAENPEVEDSDPSAGLYRQRECLPLGIDAESLDPVFFRPEKNRYILLIGTSDAASAADHLNRASALLASMEDNQIIRLSPDMSPGAVQEELDSLIRILNERKKNLTAKRSSPDFDMDQWLSGYTQICLLIEDLPRFSRELMTAQQTGFSRIFTIASGLGLMILCTADPALLESDGSDPLTASAISSGQALLSGNITAASPVFMAGRDMALSGMALENEEAVFCSGGTCRIIRVTWGEQT